MKKGFTLVELLAVIVILALLATIAVPSAISISHKIKTDMYCDKVDMILSDAQRWGNDHMSQLKETNPTGNNPVCYKEITVKDLVEQGIIKKENDEVGNYIVNPVSNASMDHQKIGIYKKNKRAYAFYMETDEELSDVCDVVEVTNRPTTPCP